MYLSSFRMSKTLSEMAYTLATANPLLSQLPSAPSFRPTHPHGQRREQHGCYGRLLRYIYVGDTFVNAELVRQGWAEAREYPPDTRFAERFSALTTEARNANIGCYALGMFGGSRSAQPESTNSPSQSQTYYVNSQSNINIRSCTRTTCSIVTTLSPGAEVLVINEVEGQTVSGSTAWYHVEVSNQTAYIHRSLLSLNRPAPRPTSPSVQQNDPAQGQQPIQQELISTPPPAAPAFSCSCSKTCTEVVSCKEAYFLPNTCGCGRRDGDSVPYENICLGG
jgi:hypothetical protein